MTITVIANLPIASNFVPSYLESIINKKIGKIALNTFEYLVDFFLSWLYCPYHLLYLGKLERVHYFRDGTPLFDSTENGMAGIKENGITLFNKQVIFSLIPHLNITFSKQNRTEYVVIEKRNTFVQIVEKEIGTFIDPNPMEKTWRVNLNEVHWHQNKIKYLAVPSHL